MIEFAKIFNRALQEAYLQLHTDDFNELMQMLKKAIEVFENINKR